MTDIVRIMDAVAEAFAPVIKEAIAAAVAPVVQRLGALEAQQKEFDARQKEWRHTGPWQQEKTYKVGNHCTQNGHTWHCEHDNYGCKPGDSDNWRLVVRAGRDLR
jgi:hypothetical protein